MRFNKLMKAYYRQKLDAMDDIQSVRLPTRDQTGMTVRVHTINWSDAFGYVLLIGILIHYFLGNKFFDSAGFMPGIGILF
jgi:hypothetical protein